ncbi:MAG TPA: c-type cytochrome [Bryobacteraceae bacterium]|nr:c-type cytochrome [Bryobacteraceae bacterium]
MSKLNQYSVMSLLALALALTPARAQEKQSAAKGGAATANQSQVERGRYIVENVAMCELCHTPRTENGEPDHSHWLAGGPAQLRPAYPSPYWALVEPRIAGRPPGTDADFIKLLTTGISRTGHPPNPPMPPFRMTRPDAEAVLAYLKSLPR